jgi:hypothetical protein
MDEAGRLALPAELPVDGPMRSVLARLLLSSPVERFQTARETRAALFAVSTASLVPAVKGPRPGTGVAVSRGAAEMLASLPPAPRPVNGALKALGRRLGGSMSELMNPTAAPPARMNVLTALMLGVVSLITFGIVPLLVGSMAASRRGRIRPFLRDGTPGTGLILDMESVATGFGKMTQVRYEFDADGRRHRGADRVMPWITERWHVGDEVPVLYIAERDYDSIIVSTT